MRSVRTDLQGSVRRAAWRAAKLARPRGRVPTFSVDDAIRIITTNNDPKVQELVTTFISQELALVQKDKELALVQKDKEIALVQKDKEIALVQKDKEIAEQRQLRMEDKNKALKAQLLREQGRLSARGFIEYMEQEVITHKGSRNEKWLAYFVGNPSLLESAKNLVGSVDVGAAASVAAKAVKDAYSSLSADIHTSKFVELMQQSGDVVLLGPPLNAVQAQLLRLVAEANGVQAQLYGFNRTQE